MRRGLPGWRRSPRRCHEQLGPVDGTAERTVGAGHGVQFGRGAVLDEGGLVQLDPLGTGGPQIGEHLRVHRKQPVQQGERLEVHGHAGRGLGQQQIRHRADEHRTGGVPEGEGFRQLGDLLGGVGGEHGVGAEFGDEVVVVGVDPLGHLQRCDLLGAPRHREVPVERVGRHGRPVPLRDGADHDAGVQDVVVVREVPGGHLMDTGGGQLPPGGPAQFGRGLPERAGGDPALPVALDGLLQFPAGALAGVAVHGGSCCRG